MKQSFSALWGLCIALGEGKQILFEWLRCTKPKVALKTQMNMILTSLVIQNGAERTKPEECQVLRKLREGTESRTQKRWSSGPSPDRY